MITAEIMITTEISRTQVVQWIYNEAALEDGRPITYDLYRTIMPSELENIKEYAGEASYENGRFEEVVDLFDGQRIY